MGNSLVGGFRWHLGLKKKKEEHLGAIISLSRKCFPAGEGGSPQLRFSGTTIIITIRKQTAPGFWLQEK